MNGTEPVPRHARPDSPWLEIARVAATEWFRDHPGATLDEYDTWAADEWVPLEFLRAGFGWQPGQPVNMEAFTAARQGLREAWTAEQRRRAGRDVPLSGHRIDGEPLAGHGASLTSPDWWNGAQRDGAA